MVDCFKKKAVKDIQIKDLWGEISSECIRTLSVQTDFTMRELSGGRHSWAILLESSDHDIPDVVAKVRPKGGFELEVFIHRDVIPGLSLASPRYLGFSNRLKKVDVIFLAFQPGVRFEPINPQHRLAAADWLFHLHNASLKLEKYGPIPVILPEADVSELMIARDLALEYLSYDMNPKGEYCPVRYGLELLEICCEKMPHLKALSAAAPTVLTHNVFISRNVKVEEKENNVTATAFDWDHAAFRTPAIDLAQNPSGSSGFSANVDLDRYHDLVKKHRFPLEKETLDALSRLGTISRSAYCMRLVLEKSITRKSSLYDKELTMYIEALKAAVDDNRIFLN